MINFRYHLVSLVAVFLALAVGIVMGSTVIDRAIVEGLRNRIDTVEDNAEARKAENDRLDAEVTRLGSYIEQTAPFSVTNRLTNRDVALFAIAGTDDEPLTNAVDLIRTAGGRVSGIIWIEDEWVLDDETAVADMAQALGVPPTTPAALRQVAWNRIAEAATPTAVASDPDVVDALIEAGFLRIQGVDDFAPTAPVVANARALVVTGSGVAEELDEIFDVAVSAMVEAAVPTVAAEVYRDEEDAPARGASFERIQDDATIGPFISTVNDLEIIEGRVAAVLALSDLSRGIVGNYGYGPDTQPVPEWTQP